MKLHYRAVSSCHHFDVLWLRFEHVRKFHVRKRNCTCAKDNTKQCYLQLEKNYLVEKLNELRQYGFQLSVEKP